MTGNEIGLLALVVANVVWFTAWFCGQRSALK